MIPLLLRQTLVFGIFAFEKKGLWKSCYSQGNKEGIKGPPGGYQVSKVPLFRPSKTRAAEPLQSQPQGSMWTTPSGPEPRTWDPNHGLSLRRGSLDLDPLWKCHSPYLGSFEVPRSQSRRTVPYALLLPSGASENGTVIPV